MDVSQVLRRFVSQLQELVQTTDVRVAGIWKQHQQVFKNLTTAAGATALGLFTWLAVKNDASRASRVAAGVAACAASVLCGSLVALGARYRSARYRSVGEEQKDPENPSPAPVTPAPVTPPPKIVPQPVTPPPKSAPKPVTPPPKIVPQPVQADPKQVELFRKTVLDWINGDPKLALQLQAIPKDLVVNATDHFYVIEISQYLKICFERKIPPTLFFAEGSLEFINQDFWAFRSLLKPESALQVEQNFINWMANQGKLGVPVTKETACVAYAGLLQESNLDDVKRGLAAGYWMIKQADRTEMVTKIIDALRAQNRQESDLANLKLEVVEEAAVVFAKNDVIQNGLLRYKVYAQQLTELQKPHFNFKNYELSALLEKALKAYVGGLSGDADSSCGTAIQALFPKMDLKSVIEVILAAKKNFPEGKCVINCSESLQALQKLINSAGVEKTIPTENSINCTVDDFISFYYNKLIENMVSGDSFESFKKEKIAFKLDSVLCASVYNKESLKYEHLFTYEEKRKICDAMDKVGANDPNKALFTLVAKKVRVI